MSTWGEFEKANPELAQFGASRLPGQVAYLGTVSQSQETDDALRNKGRHRRRNRWSKGERAHHCRVSG